MRHLHHAVAHGGWALAYVVTSAAEVVLVKTLNYVSDVRLPIYTALLVNQMWLIALPSLWWQWRLTRRRRSQDASQPASAAGAVSVLDPRTSSARCTDSVDSSLRLEYAGSNGRGLEVEVEAERGADSGSDPERVPVSAPSIGSSRSSCASNVTVSAQPAAAAIRSRPLLPVPAASASLSGEDEANLKPSLRLRALVYAATGLLTFGITLCRNLGVNSLPGSVFALLVATSIICNMALSKVFLHRRLNRWHGLAATLCLAAAGVAGVAGASNADASSGAGSGNKWAVGVPTTLGAALLIACMSVTTDRVVSRWPNKSLRIAEMSIAGSALAAVLLVPAIWVFDELPRWREQLPAAVSGSLATTATRAALIGCSLALPVAKALVRTAKYESIAAVSALGFEFVQAGATLAASLLNVLLFPSQEPWSLWYVGSLALLCAAFAAYAKARAKERAIVSLPERAQAATAALALSSMSESPAPLTLTPIATAAAAANMPGVAAGVERLGSAANTLAAARQSETHTGQVKQLDRHAFSLGLRVGQKALALESESSEPSWPPEPTSRQLEYAHGFGSSGNASAALRGAAAGEDAEAATVIVDASTGKHGTRSGEAAEDAKVDATGRGQGGQGGHWQGERNLHARTLLGGDAAGGVAASCFHAHALQVPVGQTQHDAVVATAAELPQGAVPLPAAAAASSFSLCADPHRSAAQRLSAGHASAGLDAARVHGEGWAEVPL